jgi:hypothetical protein
MQFERTFPNAKDVGALTAQHLTNKAAAVLGTAHDLLDRNRFLRQPENDGVGVFPAHVSLILDPLGGGEQVGIDRRGTFCLAR